jgi:hypothetical protein
MLVSRACRVGVEAETRTRDLQAVSRSVLTKQSDSGADRAILLLSDTRYHRQLLRDFGAYLSGAFPMPGRIAMEALSSGRDPGANAIVLL